MISSATCRASSFGIQTTGAFEGPVLVAATAGSNLPPCPLLGTVALNTVAEASLRVDRGLLRAGVPLCSFDPRVVTGDGHIPTLSQA